ncbi:hypothetical protein DPM19_15990 [Actinomadura craniellae]|uniref:PknH-like extracellular domain-containing protein n=2 Tax=Actinomadura craniellae TaxID=2231787 RepID=A0A365H5R9_9ACTN|nr:hypothetical protein DPM19_15990 [Actinomadura craniellae]
MKAQAAEMRDITKGAAPSCYLSSVKLPGSPETVVRQFSEPDKNYTGANFVQLIATYADGEAATKAYGALRSKATTCPKKHEERSEKLPNGRIKLAFDGTWEIVEDKVAEWQHIQGREKNTYPPSTSIINVVHLYYDYAIRGNVVVTSVYWQRTKPSQAAGPIQKKATEILTRQLQRIG